MQVVSWSLRRAVLRDADLLAELAGETFPLACPPGFSAAAIAEHLRVRLSPDAFRVTMAETDRHFTVAAAGDRLIGYLLVVDRTDSPPAPASGMLEVRQIYVRPEYFGTGLADQLMQRAVDRAEELGAPGLWLGTSQENARAVAFYRRHGFEVAGERTFWVGGLPNRDWVLARRPTRGVE